MLEALCILDIEYGDKGIRTPDLLNAIQTRSQLRHTPVLYGYMILDSARFCKAFSYCNERDIKKVAVWYQSSYLCSQRLVA